jgi:hypothetical protein
MSIAASPSLVFAVMECGRRSTSNIAMPTSTYAVIQRPSATDTSGHILLALPRRAKFIHAMTPAPTVTDQYVPSPIQPSR